MRFFGRISRARVMVIVACLALVGIIGGACVRASAATPSTGPTAGQTQVSGVVPAAYDVGFVSVAAADAGFHSLGLTADGVIYAWGDNTSGQLGDGSTTAATSPVKVQVPDGVTFSAVYASANNSAALSSDGDLYTWGDNALGQLGDGTDTDSSVPTKVSLPDGVTVTDAAMGYYYMVALGSDGTMYAWGDNSNGALGDGTFDDSLTPVSWQQPAGVTFVDIDSGGYHTMALTSDGQLYSWGRNTYGQFGDGTTTESEVPVAWQAPAGVTATSFSLGNGFAVAVGSDSSLYAWGTNNYGQLGDGTTTQSLTPTAVQVPAGVLLDSVASGDSYSMATGSDGALYMWGSNSRGQLGNGTTTNAVVPTEVEMPDGVSGFITYSAGYAHTLAISSDGDVFSWGYNGSGQLGNGTTTNSSVPILAFADDVTVSSVEFGGVAGTELSQDDATWSVLTPAHACGTVDVVVTATHSLGAPAVVTVTDGMFTFGSAVVVTGQPEGSTSLPAGGGEVTLSAVAEGDDAPSVQWQESAAGSGAWSDIAGATEPTLTMTVVEDTDVRAVFTNCWGSVTTDVAAVTVAAVGPSQTPSAEPSASPTVPADGSGSSGLALTGVAGVMGVLLAGLVAVSAGVVLRRAGQKTS